MIDLTKLTAEELMKDYLHLGHHAEISRRLERLEKCEAAMRYAVGQWLLWRALQPSDLSPAMEELEALLDNAARAAVEGK